MFNLTQDERRVILFLATVALIGSGIDFLAARYAPVKTLVILDANIGKVSLNAADKRSLMSVPGIGEKLASRIIAYRQENAGFKSIDELRNIKGISEYRYGKIKEHLILE